MAAVCKFYNKGACKFGDKCTKSHSATESMRRAAEFPGTTLALHATAGSAGGKVTTRTSTTTEKVVRSDGSVASRETIVREVVWSPYSAHAGQTRGPKEAARDTFGNCKGPEYDLSPDNAFNGETVAVLQLYVGETLSMASPFAALTRKGFKLLHWTALPPLDEFKAGLRTACQLWVISGKTVSVTAPYVEAIKDLVHAKKGLFLWGDNDPFFADANAILKELPETSGLSLAGNYVGDQVLKEQTDAGGGGGGGLYTDGGVGFRKHLICTGLESMYEGITIASVQGPASQRRAIIKSSDNNIVTACHDRGHARILIDGGFTRLFEDRWARTAGTERFVTNAACWLYNFEGRGDRRPGGSGGKVDLKAAQLRLPTPRTPFDLGADSSAKKVPAVNGGPGGGKAAPPAAPNWVTNGTGKHPCTRGAACPFLLAGRCTFQHAPKEIAKARVEASFRAAELGASA
jgi:hypothetical protein